VSGGEGKGYTGNVRAFWDGLEKGDFHMLIYDLVSFCDEEYKKSDCFPCTAKTICEGNCGEHCKECLDDIHYHVHQYRDEYDCERLLDYYVCRYSYKYCSEMIYALRQMDLSSYPYFHILSLGCGGAPDLMAFEYMDYEQPISYIGVDKNEYWGKIHNYIENNFREGRAQLRNNIDVLTYFESHELHKCNVIVLQYVISFFYDIVGRSGMRKWFLQLAENIVRNKPKNSPLLIIINDADSINTGRDAFPLFVEEIERVGLTVSSELRRRFKEHNYYAGSIRHRSNQNIFESTIPSRFVYDYCVAKSCESAQLILEVI
jgi:hypothetical protein